MAKRRHKIEPISVDEITDSPSLEGYDAFLRFRPVSPDETADQAIGEAPPSEVRTSNSPIGEIPSGDVPIGETKHESLYQPERPIAGISGASPAVSIRQLPIGKTPIGEVYRRKTPIGQVRGLQETQASTEPGDDSDIVSPIGNLPTRQSPIGEAPPAEGLPRSFLAETPVGFSVPGRRQKVHRAMSTQDGHSSGEQLLYEALWTHGTPESADSRIITIGYGGMNDLCRLDKTNCKKNILSLLEKLAIEIVDRFDIRKNVGNTYRVFSPVEVFRRRAEAGMQYVIRTSGVRFVDPIESNV